MYRKKNVVQKKSSASKTPSKGYAKAASSRPSPAAIMEKGHGHKGTPRRSHHERSAGGRTNPQITLFKPDGTNQILPREYLTKLRTTYAGIFTVAAFGAATGSITDVEFNANDPYRPFSGMATSPVTWMNGATPATLAATNFGVLCSAVLYNSCIVLATKMRIDFTPSGISANDSIAVALTPCINNVNPPATYELAVKQPFTKSKVIRSIGAGQGENSIELTVDWADFIGIDRKTFASDPSGNFSAQVTPAGAFSSPTKLFYFVFNMNTVDLLQPAQPMPFQVQYTHYVKFYDFTDMIVSP